MRQAGILVQFHNGRLRIRSQLGRGSAQGIGRLQGMPPLNALLALEAASDMNIETAMNGTTRNLYLKLMSDMGFLDGTAAVWADIR